MLILKNARLISFDPPSVSGMSDIVIDGNFIIAEGENIAGNYNESNVIDLDGKYVSPGLVCAHNHFYSALARGITARIAPSEDFISILKNLWWKLDRALDSESLYYSGLIGALEAIKSGTTTVIDHNASPGFISDSLSVLKKAFLETGLRGILAYEVTDRNGHEGMLEGINENKNFLELLQCSDSAESDESLIRGAIGAHASFTLSNKSLSLISEVCSLTGSGIHIHTAEDKYDAGFTRHHFGRDIIERLDEFGLLNGKSILAHGVHLSDSEISLLNDRGAFLVHNPRSNMNNGIGYMSKLENVNNAALGTDGIGSDMFEEFKFACFKSNDAGKKHFPGFFLKMLNNGNRLLERYFDKKFGSVSPGYTADLVIYDYFPPTPINQDNIGGHLAFGLSARDVETVIINGKIVYENRKFPFPVENIYTRARSEAQRLWNKMDKID